jgi:hypothetical protein
VSVQGLLRRERGHEAKPMEIEGVAQLHCEVNRPSIKRIYHGAKALGGFFALFNQRIAIPRILKLLVKDMRICDNIKFKTGFRFDFPLRNKAAAVFSL